MELLRIKDWDKHFENNRSRELKNLTWVPIPNNHDGDGYNELMDHKDGIIHFGIWTLLIEVASKCDPRGTLVRRNGKPHTDTTLARMTNAPVRHFEPAIKRLLSDDIQWLEVVAIEGDTENSQEGAGFSHLTADLSQEPAQKERREGKGREGKKKPLCFPENLDNDEFREKWWEWHDYRNEKKKPLLASTSNKQLKTLGAWGIKKAIRAIDRAIEKGWQGLFEPDTETGDYQETDPAILDYAKQLKRIRAGAVILDSDISKFYQKIRDNCGPGGVERVKAAVKGVG